MQASTIWIIALLATSLVLAAALALFTALVAGLVEAAIPPLGTVMTIDGARLRVLDVGSGRPIVLVHGLAGNMRHFTYALVDRLKDEFRVVVLDRPGCGYSVPAPGSSARLSGQAGLVISLVAALGLERPLLVGHSLGGAIALAVALDHPDRLGGLALIAPLSHAMDEAPRAFRLLATRSGLKRTLVAWLLATPLSIAGSRRTLTQVFGPDAVPDDFGQRGGGLLGLRPASFEAASRDMVSVTEDLPSMEERYATLALPVGLLCGTGDRLLDPAVHCAPLATKIPGATIAWVENGGHMVPIVHPNRTADFLKAMMARLDTA